MGKVREARCSLPHAGATRPRRFRHRKETPWPPNALNSSLHIALAGDQPKATEALAEGILRGRPRADAARRHRQRQDHGDGARRRARAEADAGALPQQDARRPALRRVPRFLSEQRGRIFRLVLRLLSARGVRRVDRHVHREGLLDQRRDRAAAPFRDAVAADAPRYPDRRVGVVHLRLGLALGLHGDVGRDPRRRRDRPRSASCASSSTCSIAATTSTSCAEPSACAATCSNSSASTKSWCTGSSSSAMRSRRSTSSTC